MKMVEISLWDKIKTIFSLIFSSPLFLVLLFGFLLMIVDIYVISKKKKGTKIAYLIVSLIIIGLLLKNYFSSLFSIFDTIFKNIVTIIYFPSVLEYIIMLIISLVILFISLISRKTNKKVSSIWIPLPMIQTIQSSLYQKLLAIEITGNFKKQRIFNQYENNYHILNAVYYENNKNNKNNNKDADDNYDSNAEKSANLSLNFTIQTADRHTDFSKRNVAPERVDILKYYLENSALIPNDTTAKNLATKIVNRIKDPIAKARAIFDWIVENSTYEMENSAENNTINERGNVRKQLENQSINNYHFRGRSADLNGLFVSLCRSIGIPARSVCGQRIAKSKLLPCLGIQDDVKTDLQHTRAEFYSPGCGWIPIDVSDVKRAEYFKTPELELKMLQTLLFGFWEMNWFSPLCF